MQAWPTAFEQQLSQMLGGVGIDGGVAVESVGALPSDEHDLNVQQLARIACALFDIPVYEGKLVESLHVLLTLFSEFRNNAHFSGN